MRNYFDYLNFIKKLVSFSPRQLEGETKTANFIIDFLKKNKIQYHLDYFFTFIPKIEKAVLNADGKFISCQGCSFIGGEIKDKDYILSSLIPSRFFIDKPNINFNPKCPDISLSNFYFAPALAIVPKSLPLILKAKKVYGEVKVRKIKHKAANILVGNINNPKKIVFAHYDSINTGAIDNASGVAVMTSIILESNLLNENFFVFSANEELSYDFPTYWGHGFRVFEERYFKLLSKAKKILVVDCVGHSPTKIFRDETFIKLAFPINNLKKIKNKILVFSGEDLDNLFRVYHSNLDLPGEIKLKFLQEAKRKILNEIC
jgi:RNAse (barnase) inhibitor barstar